MADVHRSSPFSWSAARTTAAVLLAEDTLSDEEIAHQVGVSRRAIANWKCAPAFQDRIREHVADFDRAVSRLNIAKRRERVRALDRILSGLLQVIDDRAVAHAGAVPGGGTGLLVKTERTFGSGENQHVITEWAVDTGLIGEIRAVQKQAAQELGQWSEKSNVTHSGGIRREFVLVPDNGTVELDVNDPTTYASIEVDIDAAFEAVSNGEV